ncbi:HHE domain protein [Aspergillus ruber CBS 135680]|uniref:HHE domain protein n=1 Tax=Aspergillus ruber (strain CBS 135680) TaxID=1388766 RepID=A0A017SDJ9_ASPRC|nr:HHE domain protein [Aspergillus ruber CBS 135680]EYE94315.1 HHE domain protein [Aspergillus ruber CBS 135680]
MATTTTTSNTIVEPNLLHETATHQLRAYSTQASGPTYHLRILESVKEDHREITSCGEQILQSNDADEQTRAQNMFTWELARHAVAEELVVYPAMERYLGAGWGREVAERDRGEHQGIKNKLHTFQTLKPSDPRFRPTLQSLLADFRTHAHGEETTDIPALDRKLSQEESVGLSRALDRTKMFVPSRSHPGAPSKGPFESAVGLMMAPMDLLGDLFRKWPGH